MTERITILPLQNYFLCHFLSNLLHPTHNQAQWLLTLNIAVYYVFPILTAVTLIHGVIFVSIYSQAPTLEKTDTFSS